MKVSDYVQCIRFQCPNVQNLSYSIPNLEIDPASVNLILISETAPGDPQNDYYAGPEASFARTTLHAFGSAGMHVSTIQDLVARGIYLTTAVKCGKIGYSVSTQTIVNCSHLLEREIGLFPGTKVFLLMGDVAIKALNTIAKRQGEPRVVPPGSTYKIRNAEYYYRGCRVFPSYLQAGPGYGIEKSKQRMIAQDIASALSVAGI